LVSSKSPKEINSKSNISNDTFDVSYSDKIIRHLDKVNMEPWFYIYSNYVNPSSKKPDSEEN
jgi:hypothetical protein